MKNYTRHFGKPNKLQERVEMIKALLKKRNLSCSQIPYIDVETGEYKIREVRK